VKVFLGFLLIAQLAGGCRPVPTPFLEEQEAFYRAGALEAEAEEQLRQGRYAEAISKAQEALNLKERVFGPRHILVAPSFNNLALLLQKTGDYERARLLYERSLQIYSAHGRFDPEFGGLLSNLATLLSEGQDYTGAQALLERALVVMEESNGGARLRVQVMTNLAATHRALGRPQAAEALYERALALAERALKQEEVAQVLNNLAVLYTATGRARESEGIYERALTLFERSLGPDHPYVAVTLGNLAAVLAARGELAAAWALHERARKIYLALGRSGAGLEADAYRAVLKEGQLALRSFAGLLADIAQRPSLALDPRAAEVHAFIVAEQTRGGGVIQNDLLRAAARRAVDPASGGLARRVQDLQHRRRALALEMVTDAAQGRETTEQGQARQRPLGEVVRRVDEELARETDRLIRTVPQYGELIAPDPIEPLALRNLLRAGEALVAYLVLEDRVLSWLVRPGQPVVYRDRSVSRVKLREMVAQLRASIDQGGNAYLLAGQLRPVDVAAAHDLFDVLVKPLESHLVGVRHLLVVPDDALLALPFGVLLKSPNDGAFGALVNLHARGASPGPTELLAYRGLGWLARTHAISVLPAASALRALRGFPPSRGRAIEPFIGFGDPLVEGGGAARGGAAVASRDALVLNELVRRLNRLPGTREELLAVGAALGANPETSVFLGARATKAMVKQLNATERLGRARVISFATHGLLSGDVSGLTEPALALSPVGLLGLEDPLLRLSDILELRLINTEWVVLSACNTVVGDRSGESLGGLARAFFFAGARSLLASHWSVDDRATQALMTNIFQRYATDPTLPRAEAVSAAMLSLMEQAQGDMAYLAHPFAWAPFVLVGEGG
jgi:CHAT domain-containing protein/tetratricopeptide (TPR) repeat protein